MWIFDFFKSQKIDVIRWENPNPEILISKWEHKFDEIKKNSSLIVDPGLSAIFVRNGKIEAIEKTSGKWNLETDNIPFITSFKNILSGFESHDKASVFFLKTSEIANQKWGTPNVITYIDPIYDFPVELRAFGNFTFKVVDIENFWTNYFANSSKVLIDDVRMLLTDRIVGNIANIFANKKYSYNEVDSKTLEIAKELLEATKEEFLKLGLELTDFRIEDINFSEKTEGFIDKITDKKADIASINATANIDNSAMKNFKELETLNIMSKSAENGGSGSDAMSAGLGMAMWAKMAENFGQNSFQTQDSSEEKLAKLKNLFEKNLISEDEYNAKKKEVLEHI